MRTREKTYWREVALRFRTYNGLFLELPFEGVKDQGILLPLFARHCADSLAEGMRPDRIVDEFFASRTGGEGSLHQTLYSMLQFAERQVALFDAVEDASYEKIHDTTGAQSLAATLQRVQEDGLSDELAEFCKDYNVRIVLTAHPTQFYPGEVLGIMADLEDAVRRGEIDETYELLLQMGKTRFRNTSNPTPEDEARGLLWYLENVFYEKVSEIQLRLDAAAGVSPGALTNIELGFWPGGDRDGNPYVTPETTIRVAGMLRESILALYRRDLLRVTRRLTFPGTGGRVRELLTRLDSLAKPEDLLEELRSIRDELENRHDGLFVRYVNDLIGKVAIFGFHFASLDLRQDSRVHRSLVSELLAKYAGLSASERFDLLEKILAGRQSLEQETAEHESLAERDPAGVIGSLVAARQVRQSNGSHGLHRYVISNTRDAANVLEVMFLARVSGWDAEAFDLDIVPLFETIEDLHAAAGVMEQLYASPVYRQHLQRRGDHQTIMVGFSDGTKDGGYVAANWQIFRTKQLLTASAREHGIELTFFDGRGGPPGRGGGNTHRFYRSLGPGIAGTGIHVTVQGQTVSAKFGTRSAAEHNLGQIVSAGILNRLYPSEHYILTDDDVALLNTLSADSLEAYNALRGSDAFIPFLERMTPLTYYGESKIGSRPSSRQSGEITLDSLRAIPFVGAWSQMKLNVPGYYGLGTALARARERGRTDELRRLYRDSLFFRTLMDNSMQSLLKTHFSLTRYLAEDPVFGELWERIREEAELTQSMLLEISGENELLESEPTTRESIRLREELITPVATIQQYALIRLRALRRKGRDKEETDSRRDREIRELEHLVIKSMAASVNAARNAV